ncbi:16S rRNA (cytidine(1402)-2'-O)-methyltransferase [Rhodovibrio salinarum]|uniref:Ribosomal RNA small subunit methyltransferase I n=1 Tax=Rhodovibrio salinarum TaxID=1087 RepID=A0A934UZZ5_9PROT|nr:16S rRNA (cytidine(1402)-2'-O)-methyltransferase [Rhodovibrio salinarum]MBK1697046.1 16S rRNA (cytidine(1402)-2'-O)-methyltransferase [Rhodovibrio salinarum]
MSRQARFAAPHNPSPVGDGPVRDGGGASAAASGGEPTGGPEGSQADSAADTTPPQTAPQHADARTAARPPLSAGLYVVATPIGNLGDLTFRAADHLARVDAVLCEDTRVTRRLMDVYGLRPPLISYHEHNAEQRRPEVLQRLSQGQALALVSDAGTPLISDPGYKLVRDVQDAGHPVRALPGASAALAALAIAGLPTDRFFFQGFLPSKQGQRRAVLEELRGLKASLVFYESPQRLERSLADMADLLGPRDAAVGRELTKRFEELIRAPLPELATRFRETPKGEIVIVVAPPSAEALIADAETVDARLRTALETMSVRDAAAAVAAETGWKKKQVYDRALHLKPGGRR